MEKFLNLEFIQPTSGLASIIYSIKEGKDKNGWVKVFSTGTIKARKKFSKDIKNLVVRKIIEIEKTKGGLTARLTSKGFIEYLKLKLVEAEELPNNYVCIVVFDIPEKDKKIRRLLRIFLNHNYFIPLQKSVWFSFFDVSEILAELMFYFGINSWVKIYIAKEVFFEKRQQVNFSKNERSVENRKKSA